MKFNSNTKKLGWLPIVAQFEHLRVFDYRTGEVPHNVMFYPLQSDLRVLSASLEVLVLRADGAECAFWADSRDSLDASVVSPRAVPFDIGSQWPHLRVLDLLQYSVSASPAHGLGAILRTLPGTLETLRVRLDDVHCIADLPHGLLRLAVISTRFSPKAFSNLPPNLQELDLTLSHFHVEPPQSFFDLPRTLLKLTLTMPRHYGPEIVQYLPTSLVYFNGRDSITSSWFSPISETLTHLNHLVIAWDYFSNLLPKDTPAAKMLRYIKIVEYGATGWTWTPSDQGGGSWESCNLPTVSEYY